MTRFPALRRDAAPTIDDDEVSIGPGLALPALPTPGPVGRAVLAFFEGETAENEIEILIGPGLLLH